MSGFNGFFFAMYCCSCTFIDKFRSQHLKLIATLQDLMWIARQLTGAVLETINSVVRSVVP